MGKTKSSEFLMELQKEAAAAQQQEVMQEKIVEEAKESVKSAEEKKVATAFDKIIKAGEISAEQLEEWKTKYNNKVYAVFFDEEEYYVFRYITRPEHKNIMKSLPQSATEDLYHDAIVNKCLLYPQYSPDFTMLVGAGTIDTLSLQIRIASNFIPDSVAVEMINKI